MPSVRKRRLWALIGLAAVVVAAASVLAAVTMTGDEWAGDVVQPVTSVLTMTGGLVLWLWTRSHRHVPTSSSALLQASDALAAAVLVQWERAAIERRLRYPAPIPLRWRWSPRAVTGPVTEALGDARLVRFTPMPGIVATTLPNLHDGELGDLFGVIGGLDSGRVIVLGGAGTGKSAAAILAVLDALYHRRRLDDVRRIQMPVPVLLTAHGWDPRHQRLDHWLATRLQAEYPFLRHHAYGRDSAAYLIQSGHVMLVLDGFDEIAGDLLPTAIRALDEQALFRLVVLTRTSELVDAVVNGHLHGAAALELLPVPAHEAADYLLRCQVQPSPPTWQRLACHLRTTPESALSTALDNPLMLTLVRDTFRNTGELDELLTGRLTDRAEVDRYLLNRVLPAAYRSRVDGQPGRYELDQARRWLGFLATEMNRRSTRDLTWWHINEWSPPPIRAVTRALPSAVGLGSAVGTVFGLIFGLVAGIVAGIAAGLANGVGVALALELRYWRAKPNSPRLNRLHPTTRTVVDRLADFPGIAGGLASGLAAWIVVNMAVLAGVVTAGAIVTLVASLGYGFAAGATEQLLERRRNAGPRRLRSLRWRTVVSQGTLVGGIAFGLISGLTLTMAFVLTVNVAAGLGAGIAIGLVTTLLFGIINGLVQVSADAVSPVDPVTSWRHDRQSSLAEGLTFGLAGGIAVGLAGGMVHGVWAGLAVGAIASLGETFGFTHAVSQSWLAAIAFLFLGNIDRFPRDGIRFLEDARERGVMRTVGSVYQFRHARLQDLLANVPEPFPVIVGAGSQATADLQRR